MKNTNTTEYEHALFALAHTDIRLMPFNNRERTLRLTVESNINAYALKVKFSNRYGEAPMVIGSASLALSDKDGDLLPNTLIPLTVGGVLAFELAPGDEVWSDTVRFALQAGNHFSLNIFYPNEERIISGNWLGQGGQRSRRGNYSASVQLHPPGLVSRFARTVVTTDFSVSVTSVEEIVAYSETPAQVVGCFGDSITQQSTWTQPLAKRLYHHYPGKISLCNLGIGGNRLLADSPPALGGLNGEAGITRYLRDLLPLPGLTHAIIGIGTNDIGLPGSHGIPDTEIISVTDYAAAMESVAQRLHQQQVKVYVFTLLPRGFTKPYDEEREVLRQEINHWIRNAACFDAVLDFDAVLRRTDGQPGMLDDCALPDQLHPSPLGGMLLAKSIDLSLFGEG